jgi:hypothetical protein
MDYRQLVRGTSEDVTEFIIEVLGRFVGLRVELVAADPGHVAKR